MPKKNKSSKHAGRRGLSVSLYPLTADQALAAVLAIKPEDVKKIIGRSKNRKKA